MGTPVIRNSLAIVSDSYNWCVRIAAVHVVGENKRLSLLRWRLDGRVGQSPRRFADSVPLIVVVGLAVAVCFVGGTMAFAERGQAGSDSHSDPLPITILTNSNHASVSWQVRTPGSVRIRLYRSIPGGVENLVGEVTTESGISTFEMIDDARPPGASIYQIRAVGIGGAEQILGSILCVDPGFSTRVAAMSWDSPSHIANSISLSEFFLSTQELAYLSDRPILRQPRQRPEPPVPRSVPSRC